LLGYSGCLYDFPDDQLTVVVLTNTEGQNAYAIGRALARAALNLPELPKPPAARPDVPLAGNPVLAAESKQLTGTYLLTVDKVPANLHDSYAQYRRTYRVFDENGRLMIEPLGQGAERLLKLSDSTFAMRSPTAFCKSSSRTKLREASSMARRALSGMSEPVRIV